MNDDYTQSGLRQEWSLLIHSFLEDGSNKSEIVEKMREAKLSAEQVKTLKKDLSQQRKKLNQAIEKIKIKMDQVASVVENLSLVGSSTAGLVKELDYLNHEGEKISEQIFALDEKLKKIHELDPIEVV